MFEIFLTFLHFLSMGYFLLQETVGKDRSHHCNSSCDQPVVVRRKLEENLLRSLIEKMCQCNKV